MVSSSSVVSTVACGSPAWKLSPTAPSKQPPRPAGTLFRRRRFAPCGRPGLPASPRPRLTSPAALAQARLGHHGRIEDAVQLLCRQVGALAGQLANGAAGLESFFG